MDVLESAPLGTIVGLVKAVDSDQGPNAVFVYSITHANIGINCSSYIMSSNFMLQSTHLHFGVWLSI